MIAIVLIALAAGCASALMFASIISGALISLLLFYLAPLPLMVAALGWGPIAATIGGIVAASGLGVIFGLPYCIAFVVTVALPAWWLGHLALLGRPLADPAAGNGAAPAAPATRMVSGRPHPALDRRLCRIDHDCGHADARHRRRDHHQFTAQWPAANPGVARSGIVERYRTLGHRARYHRASGGYDRRHDDADAQSLAGRQDHRDVGPAAPALARSEERGTAADDAGGALSSRWPSASSAGSSRCSRRSSTTALMMAYAPHRLCRAAHADAGAQEPRASGSAAPTRSLSRSAGPYSR